MNIKEKEEFFSIPSEKFIGKPGDKMGYMCKRRDSFLTVWNVAVNGIKKGRPVDIGMTSDLHLDYLNAQDFAEKNPAVMSSSQYREWQRGGKSIGNAIRALDFCAHTDQTVVCGDNLDYLTYGALECVEKYVMRPYPEALVALGGHDVLCCMQGKVEDTMPMTEKKKRLSAVWNNDLEYCSRIIADRVMVIVMNNDQGIYTADQCQKMEYDIIRAKKNGYTVLIFQHEPMSTGNPADTNVPFIRTIWEHDAHDFYSHFAGSCGSCDETMRMYKCITQNADVIKGVFCGHLHNEIYTEILASEKMPDGTIKETFIPQYTVTSNAYENGAVMHIIVL